MNGRMREDYGQVITEGESREGQRRNRERETNWKRGRNICREVRSGEDRSKLSNM